MVQPPTGEQPQEPPPGQQPPNDPSQPSYGQPPYGQPYEQQPQPPYGQPPYGQPPYGAGGYYPPPPPQRNSFAIAGIILAVIPPIVVPGLVFSILGLVKSKALAGAGRTLSIVGIVLSVVLGGGAITGVAIVANSTAADPGCISAESAARQMSSTISADDAAMSRDQNNASAERTDLQKFLTDMRSLQGQLATAETQAHHQSVKTQIAAMASDMNTLNSSMQAILNGDSSQINQMDTAASKLKGDGDAIDSTCSTL